MTDEIRELLERELDVDDDDVYQHDGPDRPRRPVVGARRRPARAARTRSGCPITQARLASDDDEQVNFFRELRKGDVLVHHPYSSFATSVEEFIRQASVDPKVLAIKMTLYRTSGDSSIIHSLIRAAERGKQVAALVELKARFDEANNIEWARELEKAGVHVVYGLVGLKIHTKTTLVVREEQDGMRRYCHIGTGNYNPKTARLYEDLGLLTCDPEIGADLTQLFNFLTGYARDVDYKKLLVAPHDLRPRLDGADRERDAGRAATGASSFKMNSLVDPELIDAALPGVAGRRADRPHHPRHLLPAARACPACPTTSGCGRSSAATSSTPASTGSPTAAADGGPVHYIGSADLMPRNLDRRVEALAPVADPDLRDQLDEIIDIQLADDIQAWVLGADGTWHKDDRGGRVDSHRRLQELALARRLPS